MPPVERMRRRSVRVPACEVKNARSAPNEVVLAFVLSACICAIRAEPAVCDRFWKLIIPLALVSVPVDVNANTEGSFVVVLFISNTIPA